MYVERNLNARHQRGFTLLEVLVSIALLSIATVGIVSTVSQMNSSATNLQSQVGAQSLRESLNQAISNSLSCSPRYLPVQNPAAIVTTNPKPDVAIGFRLDDGNLIQAGNSLPDFNVKVTNLVIRNPTSLGPDPCDSNATLYAGALILSEQKLSNNANIAGGLSLKDETIGNIAISMNNTSSVVTRCTAGSPTDICDPCRALGGTYNPSTLPHCKMPSQCPANTFFQGYNTSTNPPTPICKTSSVCPAGDTVVADGLGGYTCQNIASVPTATPTPSPTVAPSSTPASTAVPSPAPSASPTAAAATASPTPLPSAGPTPGCPMYQAFASEITSGGSTYSSAIVNNACTTTVTGPMTDPIGGAASYGTTTTDNYMYLSAFDNTGNYLWSSQYAQTNAIPIPTAMVQDSAGNYFITGYVSCNLGSSCSFGGTMNGISALGPNGAANAFLMKFSSTGVLQWITQLGGGLAPNNYGTSAQALAMDPYGNLYINGSTEALLGGVLNGVHGAIDNFFAKFDSSGNLLLVSQHGTTNVYYGTPGKVYGQGIGLDSSGSIYTSGYTHCGSYPGASTPSQTCSDDIFTSKFNADGTLVWVKEKGDGDNINAGSGLVVTPSGTTFMPLRLQTEFPNLKRAGSSIFDMALWAYDNTGAVLPTAAYGQNFSTSNLSSGSGGTNVAQDASGNTYIMGNSDKYMGGRCYGQSCNSTTIVKYDSSFNVVWVTQYGATGQGNNNSMGMTVDAAGRVYVTSSTGQIYGNYFPTGPGYGGSQFVMVASINADGTMSLPALTPPAPSPLPTFPVQYGQTGANTQGMNVLQTNSSLIVRFLGYSVELGSTDTVLPYSQQASTHGAQDALLTGFLRDGTLRFAYQIGGGAGSTTTGKSLNQDIDYYESEIVADTNGDYSGTGTVKNHGATDLLMGSIAWDFPGIKCTYQLGAGPGNHVTGSTILMNGSANMFIAGDTDNPFGPTMSTLQGTAGAKDGFGAVFSGDCSLQWIYEIGGGAGTSTTGKALVKDNTTGMYLTGATTGVVGTQFGAHGTSDAYVAGFTTSGPGSSVLAYSWASQLGAAGATTEASNMLWYSYDSNIYIVGTTSGFLGGVQVGTHGANDLFVASFDSTGHFNWVTQLGVAGGNVYGKNITIDGTTSIYVTGYTDSVIPSGIQKGNHGIQDAVVAKFDTNGNFKWVNQLGATGAVTQGLGISFMYSSTELNRGSNGSSPPDARVTGYSSGYLGGTQYGTHGVNDFILFRVDHNGIIP